MKDPSVGSDLAQALQALETAAAEARARAASPPPFERRRTVRVQCRRELLCRVGERHVPATALDVSLGGMRLTFAEPLPDELELELLRQEGDAEGVRARLAWKSPDGRVGGVQYLVESSAHLRGWLLELLQGLFGDVRGMVNRRRYIRVAANLPARLVTPAGEAREGVLLDLGLGGALWEAAEALSPGSEIDLLFHEPGGGEMRVSGRVLHALEDGRTAQHRIEFRDLGAKAEALHDCVLTLLHGQASFNPSSP